MATKHQAEPQSQAPVSPTLLDQRITSLEPALHCAARCLAAQTGEPADELLSAMETVIGEAAVSRPDDFLSKADGYITTFATWRVRDQLRSLRRKDAITRASSLDDNNDDGDGSFLVDLSAADSNDEPDIMSQVHAFVESLDTESRDLVNAMFRIGDAALKRNGTLNIVALAEFMGKPYRQVWRSVSSMRTEFGQALIAGVA